MSETPSNPEGIGASQPEDQDPIQPGPAAHSGVAERFLHMLQTIKSPMSRDIKVRPVARRFDRDKIKALQAQEDPTQP